MNKFIYHQLSFQLGQFILTFMLLIILGIDAKMQMLEWPGAQIEKPSNTSTSTEAHYWFRQFLCLSLQDNWRSQSGLTESRNRYGWTVGDVNENVASQHVSNWHFSHCVSRRKSRHILSTVELKQNLFYCTVQVPLLE